jgi:hypothetical protein
MSRAMSAQATSREKQGLSSSADISKQAKSNLTKLAVWISDRNIPFPVTNIGMIVMLLCADYFRRRRHSSLGLQQSADQLAL